MANLMNAVDSQVGGEDGRTEWHRSLSASWPTGNEHLSPARWSEWPRSPPAGEDQSELSPLGHWTAAIMGEGSTICGILVTHLLPTRCTSWNVLVWRIL